MIYSMNFAPQLNYKEWLLYFWNNLNARGVHMQIRWLFSMQHVIKVISS